MAMVQGLLTELMMVSNLTPEASEDEITTFLEKMISIAERANLGDVVNIFSKELLGKPHPVYESYGTSEQAVKNIKTNKLNIFLTSGSDNPIWDKSAKKEWMVNSGATKKKLEIAKEQFYTGEVNDWHAYLLIYRNNELFVYDPSYFRKNPKSNRRLKEIKFMHPVVQLLAQMTKRKLKYPSVFYSRGGNLTDKCHPMACQYLKDLLYQLIRDPNFFEKNSLPMFDEANLEELRK